MNIEWNKRPRWYVRAVGDSIRLGRQPGWNGSHISKMEATIHKRRAERSITKMVPTAKRRAQRKPIVKRLRQSPTQANVSFISELGEVRSVRVSHNRKGCTMYTWSL